MSTATNIAVVESTRTARLPLFLAGLLGVFIIGFVGFAQMEVVHNAGHDYRHSTAFPCH